jgi:hypothetical protein
VEGSRERALTSPPATANAPANISPVNFLVNLVCGLIAYCHLPKKPSLDLGPNRDLLALSAA